ncbi:MAG: hypothetical protein IH986_16110 [Planctomycetes bacterium]|nr:hypothetical protein [Planctomycetota bacterium]
MCPPLTAGWELTTAVAVGETGQIVGGGRRFGRIGHGFLLTPIILGDLNGDGCVDLADLGTLLADFGCTPPASCPGDVDGDGDTDLADLGILLSNFGLGCP